MTIFPPSGEQCEGPLTFFGDGEACKAKLVVTNPPSADPGVTGVGPSVICWLVATDGEFASEIESGSCDPPKPCKFKIFAELNIEPVGSHDAEQHYDYWHGAGTYGDPPQPSRFPTWTLGGNAVGNGTNTVEWGPPSVANPSGSSVVRLTIEVEIPCSEDSGTDNSQDVTAIALPANGDITKALVITFSMSCSSC